MRVATNQVRALRADGNDAVLVAGHMGFEGKVPEEFDGIPVKLFRAYRLFSKWGFSGMVSPSMIVWLFREIRSADVVHIHMGRDLITLLSGLISRLTRTRYVVQTHGMITPSSRIVSIPLDVLATNRILRGASKVFYLTPDELVGLREVAGDNLPFQLLVNGVPSGVNEGSPKRAGLDVLFLARLHSRKRPEYFANSAAILAAEFPEATFTISGPDEGSGSDVMNVVERINPKYRSRINVTDAIPAEESVKRIAACDIYVLPSLEEPFPMTVLEAMAAGVPVVVTDSCGLAPYIEASDAGMVIDSSQAGLTKAVRWLMQNPNVRSSMGVNAMKLVGTEFSMHHVLSVIKTAYTA